MQHEKPEKEMFNCKTRKKNYDKWFFVLQEMQLSDRFSMEFQWHSINLYILVNRLVIYKNELV